MKCMNEIERSNFMFILTFIKDKIIHIFHFIHIHYFCSLKIYFSCLALGPRKTKHVCTNLTDICYETNSNI